MSRTKVYPDSFGGRAFILKVLEEHGDALDRIDGDSSAFEDVVETIYANPSGSNETGDGSIDNPYRTLEYAAQKCPLNGPPGVSYDIDITGLGQEILPDGYTLPSWKSAYGIVTDAAAEFFPLRAAVNIKADPQLASNIPAADAVITAADLVSTAIGGGIADVVGFNDVRAEGTGDAITVEGAGIAKLVDAETEFDPDSGVTWITIAGATNPANDGTFPVVGYDEEDPTAIYYENALAVEDLAYSGTWEAFAPFVLVTTNAAHGLWHAEQSFQQVTIAGIVGDMNTVVDGDFAPIWRTSTTFTCEVSEDATGLTYTSGGTVSLLFVQDPDSGNVQVKTNKTWDVDAVVGKLFISAESNFENAVIYHNTADTLYLTNCFAPGAFGGDITEFRIMEQSAELITTCSAGGNGSRRGPGRGGLTAANIDSLTISGVKITPANAGEIGLLQWGGTLVTQGCHLTTSRFTSATSAAMSAFSYIDDALFKGSAVDMDRCYFLNQPDPAYNGPNGWLYLYFGTVLERVTIGYDTAVESDLFACKFRNQEEPAAQFFQGKNTLVNVSFENLTGFTAVAASGAGSRNRLERCNGTIAGGMPLVVVFNGGMFLINSNNAPYGDASFTGAGDYMVVDGLPDRTFADFREHALLDMDPLTANVDSIFEAVSGVTSSPTTLFGDLPYPSIQTAAWAGPGVQVTDDLNTGLVLIEFVTGVSTVLDVETAVDTTSSLIRTKTPGTPGNILVDPGDVVAATPLDPGVNGPCGEYTNIRSVDDVFGARGTQSTVLNYGIS